MEEERIYLRINNGYFFYRRINIEYISDTYPEFLIWKIDKNKDSDKMKISVNEIIIITSDHEYDHNSKYPIPSIILEIKIQDSVIKSSLIDYDTTINLMNSDFIQKYHLRIYISHPIHIHQVLSLKDIFINIILLSKIRISSKNWESIKSMKFIIISLKYHDIILGISFLSMEKIIIDSINRDILLSIISEYNIINTEKFGEEKIDERDESRKIQSSRDLNEISRSTI
jgi:hypothetical protein